MKQPSRECLAHWALLNVLMVNVAGRKVQGKVPALRQWAQHPFGQNQVLAQIFLLSLVRQGGDGGEGMLSVYN